MTFLIVIMYIIGAPLSSLGFMVFVLWEWKRAGLKRRDTEERAKTESMVAIFFGIGWPVMVPLSLLWLALPVLAGAIVRRLP